MTACLTKKTARRLAPLLVVALAACNDDGEPDRATFAERTKTVTTAPSAASAPITYSSGWEQRPPVAKTPKRGRPQVVVRTAEQGIDVLRANQPWSFTAELPKTGAPGMFLEARNLPIWATFDPATATISGTPQVTDLGEFPDIAIIGSGNGMEFRQDIAPLLVTAEPLGGGNFLPQGDVFPLPDGYQSVGDLDLDTGRFAQTFEDADLVLQFDEEGDLLDLAGEGNLPPVISENVSVDAGIRSDIGLLTGAEINADEAYGIKLVDDINYLVFLLDAGIDIAVGSPVDNPVIENITLDTPASGKIVMISDPTDTFFYRFGAQPLVGEYGEGKSKNGLIPFEPALDFPALDAFSGHKIEKGAMGIGFKVFDFFEVRGTRVTKNPQFSDIDWLDPLNSAIEYRAGINGEFNFAFSVVSVGLFDFELADGSATLDVGFDRQQAAIAIQVAPDVSWVPSWFPFVPTTEVNGQAFINGDTYFSFELDGSYRSTIPAADIAGSMRIDNDSTTFSGSTVNGGDTLQVSIEFADNVTTGRVRFPSAWAASIDDDVLDALDRELAVLQAAIQDLEDAVSDYEFEVSLRGLRQALPAIADGAIATLNATPQSVYNAARSGALSFMRSKCVTVVFDRICIDDVVNETSIANSVANTARNTASSAIVPYVNAMQNLKNRALQGDDESLRQALYDALDQAQANHRFSRRIRVTYSFPWPFSTTYTVYDQTITRTVLTSSQRASIIEARDNVYRIQETSDIMINAGAIVDQLPTEEVIATARQEVEDGIASIPVPDGLGYRVLADAYVPFIMAGGTEYEIGFNVLSPSAVRDGVADWIADGLVGD